jgi:ribosomal protein S4
MKINNKFKLGDTVLVNGSQVKITSIIVNATEEKTIIRYSVNDGSKIKVVNEENIEKI